MLLQNCNYNIFRTNSRWYFSSLFSTHCNFYREIRSDKTLRNINTHFLNSNFLFSKIFFSCEDFSMATQAKKMKYRTKYSDELKKQFSFVSKCFSSISDTSFIATFVTWTSLVLLVVLTMLKNRLIHQTTKEMNSPLNVSILTWLWSLKSYPKFFLKFSNFF